MKGVISSMATFKLGEPPDMTGDNTKDVDALFSYIAQMRGQLNNTINNLDSENMSDEFLNSVNGGNSNG